MTESSTLNIISPQIFKSVVKIFTIHCRPFYYQPWEMNTTYQRTSSGFILSTKKREILCNAHGVAHATSIRIRKYGESKKYNASVKYIGHAWDLAILTITDSKFWQNANKIELHDITPSMQDTITVLGYPTGGDDLSVTKGVVSRVGFVMYDHAFTYLLAVQIDAAINPGNSGGPCLNTEGNVVGVSFQVEREADNVGFCIPVRVVNHFIKSKTTNIDHRSRIPDLCIEFSHIENDSLKQYLKMIDNKNHIVIADTDSKYDDDTSIDSIETDNENTETKTEMEGVLVTDMSEFTDSIHKLQKHDVILEIDDIPVGDDATIAYGDDSRIHMNYITINKLEGESVKLKILRDGKILDVNLVINAEKPLVPVTLYDAELEYFIFGGCVFLPLSRPYLQSKFGEDTWSQVCPAALKWTYLYKKREYIDEQIVILSQILPSDTNVGYHDLNNIILKKVNGKKVRNIKDLANIVDDLVEKCINDNCKFITFEFESNNIIVLNIKEAIHSMKGIFDTHRIEYDRSTNLRKEIEIIEEDIELKALGVNSECNGDIKVNATSLIYDEENDKYAITLGNPGGSTFTVNIPAQYLRSNNLIGMLDNLISEINQNED